MKYNSAPTLRKRGTSKVSNPKFQKILVTGGVGFVGTHLCRRLVGMGVHVVSLDLRDPTTVVEGVKYVKGDARDTKLVTELL
jgi:nucleoside-diphosphate-sugar epimerase